MLVEEANVRLVGLSVEGQSIQNYLANWTAKEVDKQQFIEKCQKEQLVKSRPNRVIKSRLRFESEKEPNGTVKRFDIRERRCFAMLQEMKNKTLPPIKKADHTKRMRVFDAMLHYEQEVKPALKRHQAKIDLGRSVHTKAVSAYLMKEIAPKFNLNPEAFKPPNISNMITRIGRAFEFAGLLKRVAYDMRHGKTFDYKWTVDMKRHGIGVEKLEWAYMQIMHNEEFKNLNRQAKKLKKDATAIDDLDGDTKEVLKTVLDENEKLKKQIEQLMKEDNKGNGDRPPQPAGTDDQLEALGPSMCLAHAEEMTEENKDVPEPTITHINTRRNVDAPTPASYQQDPFQVIDRLKGQLTRGSLIEIKITV